MRFGDAVQLKSSHPIYDDYTSEFGRQFFVLYPHKNNSDYIHVTNDRVKAMPWTHGSLLFQPNELEPYVEIGTPSYIIE